MILPLLAFAAAAATVPSVPPNALKAHVAFLASDALAGRSTPSPGLDAAAEYIASRFRALGLEPQFQRAEFEKPAGATAANVVALLRGSDPRLRDEYVLLTAHYDHVGRRRRCEPPADCIYNGANDNASGVATMLEAAAVLQRLRPRRSVVFIAFFGEELGFYGAQHYVENPLYPLQSTVAMINLEQTGRTDDGRGAQVKRAGLTGFGLSGVGAALAGGARRAGVEIYDADKLGDYFDRSDNQPFAAAGVPAHTLAVAFTYPDYHKVTDHWDRLHYHNMAAVTRGVAAGVFAIANGATRPRWLTRDGAPPKASPKESSSSPASRRLPPAQPSPQSPPPADPDEADTEH